MTSPSDRGVVAAGVFLAVVPWIATLASAAAFVGAAIAATTSRAPPLPAWVEPCLHLGGVGLLVAPGAGAALAGAWAAIQAARRPERRRMAAAVALTGAAPLGIQLGVVGAMAAAAYL